MLKYNLKGNFFFKVILRDPFIRGQSINMCCLFVISVIKSNTLNFRHSLLLLILLFLFCACFEPSSRLLWGAPNYPLLLA